MASDLAGTCLATTTGWAGSTCRLRHMSPPQPPFVAAGRPCSGTLIRKFLHQCEKSLAEDRVVNVTRAQTLETETVGKRCQDCCSPVNVFWPTLCHHRAAPPARRRDEH